MQYRLKLDRSSKKFTCPSCEKKTFVKYIDEESGAYLPEIYGRCDREVKCTYHLNPYKDGYLNSGDENTNSWRRQATKTLPQKKQPAYIPYEVLKATRKEYEQNSFIQNLLYNIPYPFDKRDVERIIEMYHLGTICKGYRAGAVTFPFIDIKGDIRAIQVKQFDKTNHTTTTDFIHSIYKSHCIKNKLPFPDWLKVYLDNDLKVSCLFGEHLLRKYQKNPIALVEAPKTAIIAALYFGFPKDCANFIWLAVYNLSSLTEEKCRSLKNRKVILFPDLNAHKNWTDRVGVLKKKSNICFKVSDLIEQYSTIEDRDEGKDLADYLIENNWQTLRQFNQ